MLLPFLPLLFESKTPLWFNSYSTFSSGIRLSFLFLQIQHDMCQESKKSSQIGEFNVSISLRAGNHILNRGYSTPVEDTTH